MMVTGNTRRPRNVDVPRAAAILYGDWGTSKAYVIGLAFAVGGYSSFWLIAAMCLLTALVGVNYMAICRHYPDGGGVYASVRHRSVIISIVGAFLLVADYIVTAALSALSAFQYLQFSHPELWACALILIIGMINVFGPRYTGTLAFIVSIPTVLVVIVLGIFCVPHLGEAVHHVEPLTGGFFKNWKGFVGVVLALSGVEAIANSTGVMKLNRGCTDANPNVSRTSTPALMLVMVEVCLFTALLGLAMHALPHLTINATTDPANPDVDAPNNPGVRDYMLRYMAQMFIGGAAHPTVSYVAALVVSGVFGVLLLSAVNTAIVDLVAISFLMSRDNELPSRFQKLNQFGVPNLGLCLATVVPALLVLAVRDVSGLADLYAVGVVGAIATNLGACSTDRKLGLVKWERAVMFFTFVIMVLIEISLFIYKPTALKFAMGVLVVGLIVRGLFGEFASRSKAAKDAAPGATSKESAPAAAATLAMAATSFSMDNVDGPPMMCAVRGIGKTLDFAIQEARLTRRPLYVLFVRSLPILTEQDYKKKWQEDDEAREVFLAAKAKAENHPVFPCYAVSDSVGDTIVDIAATMGASYLVLGAPERKGLAHLLRGNIIRHISDNLPVEIHLLVYA